MKTKTFQRYKQMSEAIAKYENVKLLTEILQGITEEEILYSSAVRSLADYIAARIKQDIQEANMIINLLCAEVL